jgi:hypothetical protein
VHLQIRSRIRSGVMRVSNSEIVEISRPTLLTSVTSPTRDQEIGYPAAIQQPLGDVLGVRPSAPQLRPTVGVRAGVRGPREGEGFNPSPRTTLSECVGRWLRALQRTDLVVFDGSWVAASPSSQSSGTHASRTDDPRLRGSNAVDGTLWNRHQGSSRCHPDRWAAWPLSITTRISNPRPGHGAGLPGVASSRCRTE